MKITQEQSEKIRSLYKSGDIDFLQKIAQEQISNLRADRYWKGTTDETIHSLLLSEGGEKALLSFFNSLYDSANG